MNFADVAIKLPEVMLPNSQVAPFKWAVVACDQFTSQPEYWEQVAQIAGGEPSTLELIFPEVYLGKGDDQARINRINARMREYLEAGIVVSPGTGMVYVERQTAPGKVRKGLVAAVDLECYDFRPQATALIRATEGTVLDRIPPRVKIREQAVLELPHIMLLIDDPQGRVIEPLATQTAGFTKLYDTELMLGGGHVTGYLINTPQTLEEIGAGLNRLADAVRFNQKYGLTGAAPLLFAVGDGNHSLATAKTVWENLKKQGDVDIANHPARYALVEIVNVHDAGLHFEPIHRVLFKIDHRAFLKTMAETLVANGLSVEKLAHPEAMIPRIQELKQENPAIQVIGFVTSEGPGLITVTHPNHNLAVGTLQSFLDQWVRQNPQTEVDYIHGDAVVQELGSRPGNMGFFLPAMLKSDLFKTVIVDGVLPRKTFSMGEAEEKRYYIECRKIK